jgi:hypothetical protein
MPKSNAVHRICGVERIIRAKTLLKQAMASMAWLSALGKSDLDTADDGDEGYIL